MRVESDLKLGFKDVLIRPKRSTLKSRSLVDLKRTYTFLHSRKEWTGVPVIAANMDTVGTFEIAEVLAAHDMLCAIHKHYSLDEWGSFLDGQDDSIYDRIMVSSGVSDDDFAVNGLETVRVGFLEIVESDCRHCVSLISRSR